jgi:mono/diheme cytochrome c family protein
MYSRGSLWQRILVGGLVLLLGAAIWVFAPTNASAQGEGKELVLQGETVFGRSCAVCHSIGQGVLVGPDLQGVTSIREEAWLRVQIKSPSTHRAQSDPIAMSNLEEFGVSMPDLGLTEQQVEAVIAYLKTAEPAPVSTPAQYLPTLVIGVLAIVGFTLIGLITGIKRVEVRP